MFIFDKIQKPKHMNTATPIPEFKLRLTDFAIARLLGLSINDFHALSHRPIEAETNASGKIVEFYIQVSSNNSPRLLSQLQLDKNNYVRFKPEEVYKLYA
jgi:hypothetical protein